MPVRRTLGRSRLLSCGRRRPSGELMRRTAQDLSCLAGVNDLLTRAVSGHSDVEMQELYSTVRGDEMRKSLTSVVQLVGPQSCGPAPRA
jgi:hypothetical protein